MDEKCAHSMAFPGHFLIVISFYSPQDREMRDLRLREGS